MISSYIPLYDEDGCATGKWAQCVIVVDPATGLPVEPDLGTGGDDPPLASGVVSGDLGVYCDSDENRVFVKIKALDDGTCEYANPATGAPMVPMVDFFPCPVAPTLIYAGQYCYNT